MVAGYICTPAPRGPACRSCRVIAAQPLRRSCAQRLTLTVLPTWPFPLRGRHIARAARAAPSSYRRRGVSVCTEARAQARCRTRPGGGGGRRRQMRSIAARRATSLASSCRDRPAVCCQGRRCACACRMRRSRRRRFGCARKACPPSSPQTLPTAPGGRSGTQVCARCPRTVCTCLALASAAVSCPRPELVGPPCAHTFKARSAHHARALRRHSQGALCRQHCRPGALRGGSRGAHGGWRPGARRRGDSRRLSAQDRPPAHHHRGECRATYSVALKPAAKLLRASSRVTCNEEHAMKLSVNSRRTLHRAPAPALSNMARVCAPSQHAAACRYASQWRASRPARATASCCRAARSTARAAR